MGLKCIYICLKVIHIQNSTTASSAYTLVKFNIILNITC